MAHAVPRLGGVGVGFGAFDTEVPKSFDASTPEGVDGDNAGESETGFPTVSLGLVVV